MSSKTKKMFYLEQTRMGILEILRGEFLGKINVHVFSDLQFYNFLEVKDAHIR